MCGRRYQLNYKSRAAKGYTALMCVPSWLTAVFSILPHTWRLRVIFARQSNAVTWHFDPSSPFVVPPLSVLSRRCPVFVTGPATRELKIATL